MRRNTVIAFLVLCFAAGAARFVDLMLYTQPVTGFVTAGSVWLRYGAVLAIAVAIHLTAALQMHRPQQAFIKAWNACEQANQARTEQKKQVQDAAQANATATVQNKVEKQATGGTAQTETPQLKLASLAVPQCWLSALLTIASAVAGMVATRYAVLEFVVPTTSFGTPDGGSVLQLLVFWMRMAVSVSLLVMAVWFALLTSRKRPLEPEKTPSRTAGLGGCVALFLLPVLRYAEQPSSVHRTLIILPIFSALAALWFMVRLVGAQCTIHTPRMRARLSAAGLTAFLMCTCLELPQRLVQMVERGVTMYTLSLSVLLGLLGLMGAFTAFSAARKRRNLPVYVKNSIKV